MVLRPRNSARAKAILFYLAASGRSESRERLAGLLWSDWPDKKAREYLRGELFLLSGLRQEYLVEVDGRLSLNPQHCRIDLARFCELTEDPQATVEQLDAALRLWSGTFLEGIESAIETGAALFVEWLEAQRSGWESARRETLYRLAETAAHAQERIDLGIAACAQLLADEPEREEVHRLKMRLLALAGQRTAALKQYDECTAALLDELGVPPSAETNALYDQIMAGEVGPPSSAAAAAAVGAAQAPFQAPAISGHFVGRDEERARLIAWLTQPQGGGITAVVGMGGAARRPWPPSLPTSCAGEFPDGVLWATRRRGRAARYPAKLGARLRQGPEQDRQRRSPRRRHAQYPGGPPRPDRARLRRGRPRDRPAAARRRQLSRADHDAGPGGSGGAHDPDRRAARTLDGRQPAAAGAFPGRTGGRERTRGGGRTVHPAGRPAAGGGNRRPACLCLAAAQPGAHGAEPAGGRRSPGPRHQQPLGAHQL